MYDDLIQRTVHMQTIYMCELVMCAMWCILMTFHHWCFGLLVPVSISYAGKHHQVWTRALSFPSHQTRLECSNISIYFYSGDNSNVQIFAIAMRVSLSVIGSLQGRLIDRNIGQFYSGSECLSCERKSCVKRKCRFKQDSSSLGCDIVYVWTLSLMSSCFKLVLLWTLCLWTAIREMLICL